MKKVDYKKLALIGITSGLAFASHEVAAISTEHSEGIFLASDCGAGKCSHPNPKDRDHKKQGGEVADNSGNLQTNIQTVEPNPNEGEDSQSANFKNSNVTQTPSKTYTK